MSGAGASVPLTARRRLRPSRIGRLARHRLDDTGQRAGPEREQRLSGFLRLAIDDHGGEFALPKRDPIPRQRREIRRARAVSRRRLARVGRV
jgi:hypothetical protein